MQIETLVYFPPSQTDVGVVPVHYERCRSEQAARELLGYGGQIVDSDVDWQRAERQFRAQSEAGL